MTDEEDSTESQKWIARIGIWSSTCVGLGGVFLGIGASMWVTSYSMYGSITDPEKIPPLLLNVINLFNKIGPFFTCLGFAFMLGGFLYPMYLLRKKSKKKDELDSSLCHCGNKLPCRIHLS